MAFRALRMVSHLNFVITWVASLHGAREAFVTTNTPKWLRKGPSLGFNGRLWAAGKRSAVSVLKNHSMSPSYRGSSLIVVFKQSPCEVSYSMCSESAFCLYKWSACRAISLSVINPCAWRTGDLGNRKSFSSRLHWFMGYTRLALGPLAIDLPFRLMRRDVTAVVIWWAKRTRFVACYVMGRGSLSCPLTKEPLRAETFVHFLKFIVQKKRSPDVLRTLQESDLFLSINTSEFLTEGRCRNTVWLSVCVTKKEKKMCQLLL